MLCIPMIFINYPLSSIVLHVNLMFDLVMNLWWVPFYEFVCVPDYSFLCVKDKVHKLNFVTAMACFLLLCSGYDVEVIFHLSYGYDTDIFI